MYNQPSVYNYGQNYSYDTIVENDSIFFPCIENLQNYNGDYKLVIRPNVTSLYLQSYWQYLYDRIDINVQRICIECSDTILSSDETRRKFEKFINMLPPYLYLLKLVIFFNKHQYIRPHVLVNDLKKIKVPHNCRLEFVIVENKFIGK